MKGACGLERFLDNRVKDRSKYTCKSLSQRFGLSVNFMNNKIKRKNAIKLTIGFDFHWIPY